MPLQWKMNLWVVTPDALLDAITDVKAVAKTFARVAIMGARVVVRTSARVATMGARVVVRTSAQDAIMVAKAAANHPLEGKIWIA